MTGLAEPFALPIRASTDAETSGTGAVTDIKAKTTALAAAGGVQFGDISSASIGGAVPALGSAIGSADAIAVGSPSSGVDGILAANPMLDLLFGNSSATIVAAGLQSALEPASGNSGDIFTNSETFDLNAAALPGDSGGQTGQIVVGLAGNDAPFGAADVGFNSLTLTATVNGTDVFTKRFTTVASAQSFFSDNGLVLGAFPATGNLDVVLTLSTTTIDQPGKGFEENFLLGVTPISAVKWQGDSSIVADLSNPANWATGRAPDGSMVLSFNSPGGGSLTGNVTGLMAQFAGSGNWKLLTGGHLHLLGLADPLGMIEAGDLAVVGGTIAAAGSIDIESATGATMTVSDGAQIQAEGFSVGYDSGQSGSLTVSGAGTDIQNTGTDGSLQIGTSGAGIVAITGGASVADAAVDSLGVAASGTGELDISAGGNLSDSGPIVGNAGRGTLSIQTGGTVTATTLDAGVQANSSGTISIAGTNSDLTITGSLTVGGAGSGELSILNGANVSIGGDLNIGQTAGGAGSVDIENTTGTVTIGGNLNLGAGGPGTLTVGPNATVMLENGGVSTGPNAALDLFSLFDPTFENNLGVTNIDVSGTQQYLAYVNNTGSIVIDTGETYTLDTPTVYGSGGTFQIGTNAGLIVNADTMTGQTIAFADATGKLTVGFDQLATIDVPPSGTSGFTPEANPNLGLPLIGGFNGTIAGFAAGDVITVDTEAPATFSQSGSVVSVIENGTTVGALTFATAADADTAANTSGALVDQVICFCAGTAIATPDGDVLVERLSVGDRALTLNGEARPIIWIGSGKVLATRGRRNAATPVIVHKGALADNVPHRDLRVTKGHSLYFDGVLIPVEFLVNHRTILWDDRAQEVTIYHVELATHDVLVANGAPAESYRDDGNRWLFQNGNAGWALPPQAPCAPVLTGGPIVDDIWRRLLERAGPCKGPPLTDDPDLHLLVDGRRIDAIERTADRYAFRLAAQPRAIRVRSRAAVPQELGVARDARQLGAAVRRILLLEPRRQRDTDVESASLIDGWHPFEIDNGIRWTDGDAAVPTNLFAGMSGAGMLILQMGPTTRYIDDGRTAAAA